MHILLVNDDGIQSAGLRLLARELAKEHRVTVAAPDSQRSAASHGLTMREPFLACREELGEGIEAWAVAGTPADCTRLALDVLCPRAELVISGPNVGYNVAFDILYSGTVAAALEGAMHGVPSIAVSAAPQAEERAVVEIFLRLFRQLDLDRDVKRLLNINIPALPLAAVKGVRWVPQGLYHQWDDHYYVESREPAGDLYRFQGVEKLPREEITDDSAAVLAGYVALTPLTFNLYDREAPQGREIDL